jgi:hypothetical protein
MHGLREGHLQPDVTLSVSIASLPDWDLDTILKTAKKIEPVLTTDRDLRALNVQSQPREVSQFAVNHGDIGPAQFQHSAA